MMRNPLDIFGGSANRWNVLRFSLELIDFQIIEWLQIEKLKIVLECGH